jgi:hypothetical protein
MQNPLGRARASASQPLRSGGLSSVKPSGVAQAQLARVSGGPGPKKKRKAMQAALAAGPTQNGTGW